MMTRLHGVIVGEYGVGKTSLLYGLVGKKVPTEHLPTLMEIYCLQLGKQDSHGHDLELVLTDTPGNDDYLRITQMAMTSKDIVLLCYSAAEVASFDSISDKWITEIKNVLPDAPIVLVATKSDLYTKQQQKNTVTSEAGKKKAKEIGAATFVECCAMNQNDMSQFKVQLSNIILDHIIHKKKNSQACVVM